MANAGLEYAPLPAELSCHETAAGVRVYVPFRRRERLLMAAWMLPLLTAVPPLLLWAGFNAAGLLGVGIAAAIVIGFGVLWAAVGVAACLTLWFTRGSVVECDGTRLWVRGYVSRRTREWPRAGVRRVSVGAMPLIPVATLLVHVGYDPPVRVGLYRPAELGEVARRLSAALGLPADPPPA